LNWNWRFRIRRYSFIMPGVTNPADLLFEHYCWPVTAVPLFCDNL